ncbi:uncharacterized protein LOC117171580 [Belonocnema kinseyi]|uniref:uncharacterized protein LOC117171580 n=1 Tax=Belonocnema kinseyi TaxID=2817044 RepID=UPI00143D9BAD|nr:uncharacterized protein LOC117171580 [Belonocnema kinseyi]
MADVETIRNVKRIKEKTDIGKKRGIETSEIEKLTDDCLIEIFQHLPTIAEKIRIERVCKRWQNLSQRSWTNFKSLNFSAKTWGMKANPSGELLLIRSIDLDKIIRLSGRYLTRIITDIGKFAKICNLLPKLQDLQLIDDCLDRSKKCADKYSEQSAYQLNKQEKTSQCTYDPWQVIISWLISHGRRVTTLKLEIKHNHYKEDDFARFLGEMKQLECFHLYNCEYLDWSGTCLLHLPFKIVQEIFLICNYKLTFDRNIIPLMIKQCKKLQAFGLEGGEGHADGILEGLPSQSNTFKELRLQFDRIENPSLLFSTMSMLVHLEKLDIAHCNAVTDEFLEVISKKCKKLTYLHIYNCRRVTDRGVSSICDLETLTYLSISVLPEIRFPPLEKLKNLLVLDLHESQNIQEECLFCFLEKAHQLRALDVSDSPFVTNLLLSFAAEIVRKRNTNIGLDLCVTGTGANINSLVDKPPLLNFVMNYEFMLPEQYGIKEIFADIRDHEISTY